MSFWGKLAQIGLGIAAPFTGGATAALIPAIGAGVGLADNALSKPGAKMAGLTAGVDANGNPINAPTNSAYAAQEQALLNNRAQQAKIDQAGPAADKLAMQNALRAGLIARMNPNAAPITLNGQHVLPSLAPSATGIDINNTFQKQMAARQAAGKSMTAMGVPDATQEEITAHNKALDAAGIGTGLNSKLTTVGNAINTGLGMANFGNQVWDKVAGIWRDASGKPTTGNPSAYETVGPQQPYENVGPPLPSSYADTGDYTDASNY